MTSSEKDLPIWQRVKDYIYANDKLFSFLGAEVTDMGFGFAEVRMKVKPEHLNAAEVCQGGVLFTLADLAFALASNSYGTLALAMKANITYVKPAHEGDVLIARASEFSRGNRTASYHIVITKEAMQEKIAFFEGLVYRFDEQIFKEEG